MRQALGLVLALDKNHVWWSTPKSQHREVKTGEWGDQEHPLIHSSVKVSVVHKRLYPRNKIREATSKKTTECISFGRGLQSVSQHRVEQWLSPMELVLADTVRASLCHTGDWEGRRNWKCCLACGTIIKAWWGDEREEGAGRDYPWVNTLG